MITIRAENLIGNFQRTDLCLKTEKLQHCLKNALGKKVNDISTFSNSDARLNQWHCFIQAYHGFISKMRSQHAQVENGYEKHLMLSEETLNSHHYLKDLS